MGENALNRRWVWAQWVAAACVFAFAPSLSYGGGGRPISLPIAYAIAKAPGVMLFMNQDEDVVLMGNRDPGNWLFSAPPGAYHLEHCEAAAFQCLIVADFHPIIVGEMTPDRREIFPELAVAVTRSKTGPGPCDTFRTTPIQVGQPEWVQKAVFCEGLGIVQIALSRHGVEEKRLDLKSAQGLLSSGALVSIGQPISIVDGFAPQADAALPAEPAAK